MPSVRTRSVLSTTAKQEQLLALARRRQATRMQGYACIGDFHDGLYECDHVSPPTRSAGNLDADVMVMLQDWNSSDKVGDSRTDERVELGYTPNLPTNKNLDRLLNVHLGLARSDTYITNVFPFVKPGGTSEKIPKRDMVWAAREFALPQVTIVNPKLLICIGKETFNSLRVACALPTCPDLDSVVASPFDIGETRVWGQAHTAQQAQNTRNRGGVDRVSNDWMRMKQDYERVRAG